MSPPPPPNGVAPGGRGGSRGGVGVARMGVDVGCVGEGEPLRPSVAVALASTKGVPLPMAAVVKVGPVVASLLAAVGVAGAAALVGVTRARETPMRPVATTHPPNVTANVTASPPSQHPQLPPRPNLTLRRGVGRSAAGGLFIWQCHGGNAALALAAAQFQPAPVPFDDPLHDG